MVSYLRVSTGRQGRSGSGLEAHPKEFVEVESGKNPDRPVLAEAIKACRLYGAKLVIAKIDRLSRDAHFLLCLEKAGVDFVAADMPAANRLTVGIMAMVADEERRMISAPRRLHWQPPRNAASNSADTDQARN
jgi:DNA invertase Pin-like site-specific DNA recombinase